MASEDFKKINEEINAPIQTESGVKIFWSKMKEKVRQNLALQMIFVVIGFIFAIGLIIFFGMAALILISNLMKISS